MSPLPPALSALCRRLGVETLDGVDASRAESALDDATTLALAEVRPATAARWIEDAPHVVTTVILKAARREYENPQGYRSENLGEYGATVDVASGVYLTAAEVALVRRAESGHRGPVVGTVRTPSAYA
ncbi:hypothetical protein [Cellulosimicrobium cellulans]|uniref:Head-to-tail adaptor n=1 Tax=Cellulosimicrobium cellulans TaxID=1710 RepID=A0A4Y4DUW8_CELCE|nr:hypothetical protein [Cellulosimicrobium cellulans]GED09169.1 hypothetical protein CCE02nite_11680 [Cellulosimicrobium cellulans]